MMKSITYATVAAIALASTGAGAKTASGASNGLAWTANSTIVGQTSTGTIASGGNPIYLALNGAGYSGSVGMLMTYANGNQFVCSGSLLTSGKILTAAHCVSDGFNNGPGGIANGLVRTQVLFQNADSNALDANIYAQGAGVVSIDVASYNVNIQYTGEVIDQNDIAVLTLSQAAPVWAQRYEIYTGGDLTGQEFNVNGYGRRSVIGGAEGYTGPGGGAGTGRRRQGDNLYDYRLGDAAFGGFFDGFFGSAETEFSYVSDFDRDESTVGGRYPGEAGDNNQSCFVAQAVAAPGADVSAFCSGSVGPNEVAIAGGDSGGAAFINGRIASVNSYSLTFGLGFGDYKCDPAPGNCLNGSWGEMNGFVPTFIHADFINGVPEPSTWAMLILGFGVVGGALRRRTKGVVSFA